MKYDDLIQKAVEILQNPKNWAEEGWVSKQTLYMELFPLIDSVRACRIREYELSRQKKKSIESIEEKIQYGRKRICSHVVHSLKNKLEFKDNLIKFVPQKFLKKVQFDNKTKHKRKKEIAEIAGISLEELNNKLNETSKNLGLSLNTLLKRLYEGWDLEKTISTPKFQRISGISTKSILELFPYEWTPIEEMKEKLSKELPKEFVIEKGKRRWEVEIRHASKRGRNIRNKHRTDEELAKKGIDEIFKTVKDIKKSELEINDENRIRRIKLI